MLHALDGIARSGFSWSRCIELGAQWNKVRCVGYVGPSVPENLALRLGGGDREADKDVDGRLYVRVGNFLHAGVRDRRDDIVIGLEKILLNSHTGG